MRMIKYYQFEVALAAVNPKIFRVFNLPADASFFDLHAAIQLACGWANYHAYAFENEDEEALAKPSSSEFDDADEDDIPDDVALKLSSYFQDGRKLKKCFYLYDLSDRWLHSVTLQHVFTDERIFKREFLDGARAFPPENCGGIRGYEELRTLQKTGKIPDSIDWDDAANIIELLEEWDPEEFNFEEIKAAFDFPLSPLHESSEIQAAHA
jgi:hypothetical protein